jgi:hypothetical protein
MPNAQDVKTPATLPPGAIAGKDAVRADPVYAAGPTTSRPDAVFSTVSGTP